MNQEQRLTKIEAKIDKIVSVLIKNNPDLKYEFCEHEPERVYYQQDFQGKSTGGRVLSPYNHYQCKKCWLMVDESGNPVVRRV